MRRINPIVTGVLAELRTKLEPHYSEIGRPSIDPELMLRMLIIGYCYGIRFERKLCEDVELHLAYRWFCRLDLDDKVPDHSTFSVNRHGRFRDSDILRQLFEAVVRASMDAGLVKGEGFAVDASVMEADASRYHGKALDEIDWSAPEFAKSCDERKRVEMRFAHLKTHHRFERMRLRGLTGARDEFHLAAIAQNLKTLAKHIWRSPPSEGAPGIA